MLEIVALLVTKKACHKEGFFVSLGFFYLTEVVSFKIV